MVADVWVTPRQPRLARSSTAQTSDRQVVSPGSRPYWAFPPERSCLILMDDKQGDTGQPWVDPGTADYRVTATVPVGAEPRGIAVDPDANRVYVALGALAEIFNMGNEDASR